MAESKLYSTMTEMTMSLLPEHHPHRHGFEVKVTYVGRALWEVRRDTRCLADDGETWVSEFHDPEVHDPSNLKIGRWLQHEAMRHARNALPGLRQLGREVRDGEVVEVNKEEIST